MHNFFLHKNILIFRRFFNSANRFTKNILIIQEKIQILSHLLTCKLLKSLSVFTSKTIFCDFSANKTIKYTLMFK